MSSDVVLEVSCELDDSLTLEVRVDEDSDIWIGGSEFTDRLLLKPCDARAFAEALIVLADAAEPQRYQPTDFDRRIDEMNLD